tara:strand:+ start:3381 stop:3740 length:360 start_codon:yes stop_codon:yes gene_type:complete
MTETPKPVIPKTGENMTIDDLDKVLIIHKLNRLDAIRNDLVAKVEELGELTVEKKTALDTELKEAENADSKGDDIVQKALDETIERVKKELSVFEDHDNLSNLVGVVEVKIQHLKFFGC